MRSQQINLTEEEKETLKAEGLPIPTTLPLTKACDDMSVHTCIYIYVYLASGVGLPSHFNKLIFSLSIVFYTATHTRTCTAMFYMCTQQVSSLHLLKLHCT